MEKIAKKVLFVKRYKLANDMLRDEYHRRYSEGLQDAYAYVVQMFEHSDTIGTVDYKNIHKMKKAKGER